MMQKTRLGRLLTQVDNDDAIFASRTSRRKPIPRNGGPSETLEEMLTEGLRLNIGHDWEGSNRIAPLEKHETDSYIVATQRKEIGVATLRLA